MNQQKKHTRFFLRSEKGSILVEAALFMPILIALLLLSIETSRYILAHQKASRTSSTIGDLLARSENISAGVSDVLFAADHVMQPFTLGSNSVVIASVVTRSGSAAPTVVWQTHGAGNASFTSRIGAQNATPTFPDNFNMRENETLVAVEFFFVYQPWFRFKFWDDREIYNASFYKPRLQNATIN